jgi:hypothetical protein
MRIVRTTVVGILAVVLFASLAALALAGDPAGGCGQGPPAGQYHGPPSPPGSQYGGPPGGCPHGS